MSRAVLNLAKGAGKCTPATRTVTTVVPGPASGGGGTTLTVVPSPGAPPGTVSLGLALPTIGGSPPIDLSPVLGGGALPSLTELVPVTRPLLAQVLAALGDGDVGSLIEVRRPGDRVIQLVSRGLLGTLLALVGDVVGDVTGYVGRIQLV